MSTNDPRLGTNSLSNYINYNKNKQINNLVYMYGEINTERKKNEK